MAGGECEECKKKQTLQRASLSPRGRGTEGEGEVPSIVHEVLRSPGQPLDPVTRAFMEPRFGHDFSQVRVHTDAKAAESALAVEALAYTVGRNIAFSYGQYAPGTSHGLRLLAHELAHVVQQDSESFQAGTPLQLGSAVDMFEQQANTFAEAAAEGVPRGIDLVGYAPDGCILQRQVAAPSAEGNQVKKGRVQRPLIRPCDAWEYNPADFSREIAKQYVQQEFPPFLTVDIASVDCGDVGDECLIYFTSPAGFTVHVMLDHKPVYVSAVRIDPVSGRRPFCDYSYECKRSGELVLNRLRCSEPKSGLPAPTLEGKPEPTPDDKPIPTPLPVPSTPRSLSKKPVEVTVKASVESESEKEEGQTKREESRKVSVEVMIPIREGKSGNIPFLRTPIVFFGKLNLEVARGTKSKTPGKPGEAPRPQAFWELKASGPIVSIEKERIPVPLRPTIGFDLSAVGSIELKKKGVSLEGGGEANLELKVPFLGPLFFFGKGTGAAICGKEEREDFKCLLKWGVDAGVGATFGGEPKK